MDELQILNKRSDFDDIIYRLCEGTGRLRGKKDGGIQNIKTWRNCIITTGERPITSMSSGGGAVNRVIEIECNGGKFFKNPREFCRTIQANNYITVFAVISDCFKPFFITADLSYRIK